MNEPDLDFLMLIPSTEPANFSELCSALAGDVPTNKDEWRELFFKIKLLEADGYVEVERTGGKLEGIQLTAAGAVLIRDRLDKTRGLLSLEGI